MVTVTAIYDDSGKKIGEVARCSHRPLWFWREVIIGVSVAILLARVFLV
ncbi:MAG: hypothetical protein GY743_23540 [Planctomycetaceae bacterium]|nr:hypothetical protein [Planctomycetaceae bacterium]